MPEPGYRYWVRLTRIIDGDTVEVVADLGFNVALSVTVRLFGINTPERGHELFKAASKRLEELVDLYGDDGWLLMKSHGRGKYGRWLGVLYSSDGQSLNDLMIESGLAEKYLG